MASAPASCCPRAAVGTAADADRLQVSIEVAPGRVPPSVDAGAVVDVFVLDDGADEPGGGAATTPVRRWPRSPWSTRPSPTRASARPAGLRQIVLAVPEEEVADFHTLLDSIQDPVISVVRRP